MSTALHFGPEWMRDKRSSKSRVLTETSSPMSTASQSGSTSYSSVLTPSLSQPPVVSHDAAHPFKYSKDEILQVWRESGGKGTLGLEVERWEGVVREIGADPICAKEMDEADRKLFVSVNSDIRRRMSHDLAASPLSTRPKVSHTMSSQDTGSRDRQGTLLHKKKKDDDGPPPLPRKLSLSAANSPSTLVSPPQPSPFLNDRPRASSGYSGLLGSTSEESNPWSARRTPSEAFSRRPLAVASQAEQSSTHKRQEQQLNEPPSRHGPKQGVEPDEVSFQHLHPRVDSPEPTLDNFAPGMTLPAESLPDVPPGLGASMDPLSIEWSYIDPSGNTQGPFAATTMQKWHEDGYFTPDLPMRRDGIDHEYVPLGELLQRALSTRPFLGNFNRAILQNNHPSPAHFYNPRDLYRSEPVAGPFDSTSNRNIRSANVDNNLLAGLANTSGLGVGYIQRPPVSPDYPLRSSSLEVDPFGGLSGVSAADSPSSFSGHSLPLNGASPQMPFAQRTGVTGMVVNGRIAMDPLAVSPQQMQNGPWHSGLNAHFGAPQTGFSHSMPDPVHFLNEPLSNMNLQGNSGLTGIHHLGQLAEYAAVPMDLSRGGPDPGYMNRHAAQLVSPAHLETNFSSAQTFTPPPLAGYYSPDRLSDHQSTIISSELRHTADVYESANQHSQSAAHVELQVPMPPLWTGMMNQTTAVPPIDDVLVGGSSESATSNTGPLSMPLPTGLQSTQNSLLVPQPEQSEPEPLTKTQGPQHLKTHQVVPEQNDNGDTQIFTTPDVKTSKSVASTSSTRRKKLQTSESEIDPEPTSQHQPTKAAWSSIPEEEAKRSKQTGPGLREIQESERKKEEQRKAVERESRRANKGHTTHPVAEEAFTTTFGLPTSQAGSSRSGKEGGTASPAVTSPNIGAGGAVWSNVSRSEQGKKTMKEIQEEEARRKAAAKEQEAITTTTGKRGYAESAHKISATPATTSGGAWTTVGSKGASANAASARPAVTTAARAAAPPTPSIAASRSASNSNTPSRQGSTAPGHKQNGGERFSEERPHNPSLEFLQWLKESLKGLNRGVNVDDFMQILLSFPVDPSPETVELIQEQAYANSTTIDGRRFAAEFVAKRKEDYKKSSHSDPGTSSRAASLAEVVRAPPKPPSTSEWGYKVVKRKGKNGKSN